MKLLYIMILNILLSTKYIQFLLLIADKMSQQKHEQDHDHVFHETLECRGAIFILCVEKIRTDFEKLRV